MEWIEGVQRTLGAPVLGFVQHNWIFLLVIGAIGVWWLLGSTSSGGFSAGIWLDGNSDQDSGDSGGDSGGDGGGGGD